MKFYSQFEQDKWLFENHFKDKKKGFFLEIGADDGIDKSNTKFYEELGWNGMCIKLALRGLNYLKKIEPVCVKITLYQIGSARLNSWILLDGVKGLVVL